MMAEYPKDILLIAYAINDAYLNFYPSSTTRILESFIRKHGGRTGRV
jgi:hypothetical protein